MSFHHFFSLSHFFFGKGGQKEVEGQAQYQPLSSASRMQWNPRTAWKVSNLNTHYGKGYIGLIEKGKAPYKAPQNVAGLFPSRMALGAQPDGQAGQTSGTPAPATNSKRYSFKELQHLYKVKQIPFVDLRDYGDVAAFPGPKYAYPLHHHDLLSGACSQILPKDKSAEIVVFASNFQRAINGFNALVHHGYRNVVVADFEAVKDLDSDTAPKKVIESTAAGTDLGATSTTAAPTMMVQPKRGKSLSQRDALRAKMK